MQCNKVFHLRLFALLLGSGVFFALCCDLLLAQEKEQNKFGSSLKRLKWNKKKEVAIDKDSGEEAARNRPTAINDPDVLRIETALVTFDLLVTDQQGNAIKGLKQEDFVVWEDGISQQITTLSTGDDVALPRSIVLIMDYSGSQYPYLELSLAAAKTLVERLRPKDKMAVVTDDVELLQGFTNNKNQLKVVLDTLQKRAYVDRKLGRSLQYSALFAVLQELLAEAERPIIIFQTDGDEWVYLQPMTEQMPSPQGKTNFGLADVIKATQRERVTIYAVIPGIQLIGFSPSEQLERAKQVLRDRWNLVWSRAEERLKDKKLVDTATRLMLRAQEALVSLVTASGGWHNFLETPQQAAGIYERILTDINRRYIIGYYPSNEAKDGALRKVRFEIRGHPEYIIRGRQSYYAPFVK